MSHEQLNVDLDALDQLTSRLNSVANSFSALNADAESAARHIPHHQLATAVDKFATRWASQRRQLTARLETVRDIARTTRTAFLETDNELAANARGEGQ